MKNKTKKLPQNGTLKKSKRDAGNDEGLSKGLRKLFVDELQNIYQAEKALTKVIPKLIKNATASLLAEVLTGHLEVTKEHVTRLEEVFSFIGEKADRQKRKTMAGIIKEAKDMMRETKSGIVRDAVIISATKKIEHYEIAAYSTLCSYAKALGETDATVELNKILEQEIAADEKLSEISSFVINAQVAGTNEDAVSIISISVSKQTLLV